MKREGSWRFYKNKRFGGHSSIIYPRTPRVSNVIVSIIYPRPKKKETVELVPTERHGLNPNPHGSVRVGGYGLSLPKVSESFLAVTMSFHGVSVATPQ